MNIEELIKKLSKIKDQKKEVKIFNQNRVADWLSLPIDDIIENDDHVLIGNELPSELHERDYKYS